MRGMPVHTSHGIIIIYFFKSIFLRLAKIINVIQKIRNNKGFKKQMILQQTLGR